MVARFEVKLMEEAKDYLTGVDEKVREKMLFNIRLARFRNDPDLLKKLNDNIWEFRTRYGGNQYRLLAFWDKRTPTGTMIIVSMAS